MAIKRIFKYPLSRRGLLKVAGGLGALSALAGCSGSSSDSVLYYQDPEVPKEYVEEHTFGCACRSNCQSNCRILAYKRNGRVIKTSMAPLLPENGMELSKDGKTLTILDPAVAEEAYSKYNRVCLRGLSHVQRLYSSTRVKFPMLQKGERGNRDTFVQITWEEAIKLVADKIVELYDASNPAVLGKKICSFTASGNYGAVHGGGGASGLMGNILNTSKVWTSLDMALPVGLSKVMGAMTFPFITGNELRDIKNAKNLFLWGSNMAEAHLMGWSFVNDGKKVNGGKIENVISIDVMANTTSSKADYFYAIRPGSDTMVALAMINDIITRGLYDKPYLMENTIAPYLLYEDVSGTFKYLKQKDLDGTTSEKYVAWDKNLNSGNGGIVETVNNPKINLFVASVKTKLPAGVGEDYAINGTYTVTLHNGSTIDVKPAFQMLAEKTAVYTPEYAESYTNVSPANLRDLVNKYVDGPSTIYLGFGTSHHYNSHNFGHAVATLGAITGNIGKEGASIGNFFSRPGNLSRAIKTASRTRVPYYLIGPKYAEDLRNGTCDVKMIMVSNGNPVSNYVNIKKDYIDTIFNKQYTDFIVTHDTEWTDTARYSDLVLPAAHWFEVEDVLSGSKYPFTVYQEKVLDPLGDAKSDMAFAQLLAAQLKVRIPSLNAAFEQYFYTTDSKTGQKVFKSDWDYVSECVEELSPTARVSPINLKAQKAVRWQDPEKINVSLHDGTEIITTGLSGKLEFFCEDPLVFIRAPFTSYISDLSQVNLSTEYFPEWVAPDESWNGPGATAKQLQVANDYPLIYMQEHTKWRVHTQWTEIPWLRELDPEPVLKINPADAGRYGGIQTGDKVKISNERGSAIFKAIITAALPEGMINVPKGWERYKSEAIFGAGTGGYNDLTSPVFHPIACDHVFYDVRVKIEKLG